MLEQKEPGHPIHVENIYKSFEELLSSSKWLPPEFTEDTQALDESHKNFLTYSGSEAVDLQLNHLIDQLKEKDPEKYISRLVEVLQTKKKLVERNLFDDLMKKIRYGK